MTRKVDRTEGLSVLKKKLLEARRALDEAARLSDEMWQQVAPPGRVPITDAIEGNARVLEEIERRVGEMVEEVTVEDGD